MVISVHLARSSPPAALRGARRRPREAAGLIDGQPMLLAPLTPHAFRPPAIYGNAWIAGWESREAFERAEGELAPGDYRALLAPVRVVGGWSAWSAGAGLPRDERPAPDGPLAVLTLGRLKPARVPAFLRASAGAERDALHSPAMRFGAAMAWPQSLTVATFSLWNDLATMRAYVVGGGHAGATTANARRTFHRESAFIRCEILAEHGTPPARTPTTG